MTTTLEHDKARAARALMILQAAAARIEKSHPGAADISSPADIESLAAAVDHVLHFVLQPQDFEVVRRAVRK